MSINVIPVIEEINTPETFMLALKTALIEGKELHDEVKFSITTIHRQDTDSAESALSLQVNDDDQLVLTKRLTYDQVADLIELCAGVFPHKSIPVFAKTQLEQSLMSVYGQECDEVELSRQIEEQVLKGAAYQGLSSTVTFHLEVSGNYKLTYDLGAEIYTDTEIKERKFLEKKGVDPDMFQWKPGNRVVPMIHMELTPFVNLFEDID